MSIRPTSGKLTASVLATSVLLMGGLATMLCGQSPEHRLEKNAAEHNGHAWKASDLIGQSVYSTGDQEKGKIKDLMISPDGHIEYAAVSFGGFLGIGDKLFAVPMDAIHLEWKDNKVNRARVDVTEESIKQRQGFDENHWPRQADHGFMANEPGRLNGQK